MITAIMESTEDGKIRIVIKSGEEEVTDIFESKDKSYLSDAMAMAMFHRLTEERAKS